MTSAADNTNTIAILQYNLNKNQSRTHSVLNDPSSAHYTILMLQEQYWSKYTESSLTHGSWTLIEAQPFPDHPPQSAIYVYNRVLDTTAFKIIQISVPDITAIAINTTNTKPTMIINMYNATDENLITPLLEHLETTRMSNLVNSRHSWSPCVNLLKLPDHKDKEMLGEKLLYAINAGAGFDLS